MKKIYFLALLVSALLGCGGDRDFVVINLASLQGTPQPFNTIEAFINGGEGRATINPGGQFVVPLTSSGEPLRFVLNFPPEFRDQEVSIFIQGLLDGVDVFSGEATAIVGRSDRPANIFVEFCGNQTIDSLRSEECDDANNTEGDGCDSNCTVSACGNGILAPGEFCYLPVSLPTAGEQPDSIAVGDVNKDGNSDLAAINLASENISLFLGNGDGTFQEEQIIATGGALIDILIGDLNNDTNPDIFITKGDEGTIALLLGNGDGTFQGLLTLDTENPLGLMVAEFFNDDINLDIAALNSLGSASILLGNGDGTFQPQLTFDLGGASGINSLGASLATGRFNVQDNTPDLITTNLDTDSVTVILGNNDGTFFFPRSSTTGSFPLSVAVGDFNEDGFADAVTVNRFADQVSVLLGTGDGSFQPPAQFFIGGNGASVVTVGDLDLDGSLDILAPGTAGTLAILGGNGDGTFQPPVNLIIVGIGGKDLSLADFNQDGIPDIAAVSTDNALNLLLSSP